MQKKDIIISMKVKEYNYNEGEEFYTMDNYSVNLVKKDFNKKHTETEKLPCGEAIYVC